jgi:hypothetical protein
VEQPGIPEHLVGGLRDAAALAGNERVGDRRTRREGSKDAPADGLADLGDRSGEAGRARLGGVDIDLAAPSA